MSLRKDYWREFWTCCLCGGTNTYDLDADHPEWVPEQNCREKCFCGSCGCSWRDRAIGFGVLHGLKSASGPLRSRARDTSIRGLGVGDSDSLSVALSTAFDYVNTHVNRFPELDIRRIPSSLTGQFDFVTCSDVLEHVLAPVELAISGLNNLLSDQGFAVLSVPVYPAFKEHYPGLVEWREVEGRIDWVDEHGAAQTDESPTFHGGTGRTLELRQWTAETFEAAVLEGGFSQVEPLPFVPSIGVPHLFNMGCWLAYR